MVYKMAGNKSAYKRIVVKIGTCLITGGGDSVNHDRMSALVEQVARLHAEGKEVVVVSSGAVAAGRDRLGLSMSVKGVPLKQVLAAVGQGHLVYLYGDMFARYDIAVAQALLTKDDLADRAGYLNARNTLLALLGMGVVCIVNENDVVAIDELDGAEFGDNDNLSAMVANLIDADLLLMLSDIGGLHTADPRCDPQATLIPEVARIDKGLEKLAAGTPSRHGTGGMITKMEAAKLATASGVTVIIADGREADTIRRAVAGEDVGTRFLPTATSLESRQRWMLSGLSTRGKLMVDAGAAQALREHKRSLLAAGISGVKGAFKRGDIVKIVDTEGTKLGYGITNYSSADIDMIKGAHSGDIAGLVGHDYGSEVVHRDNLVVL